MGTSRLKIVAKTWMKLSSSSVKVEYNREIFSHVFDSFARSWIPSDSSDQNLDSCWDNWIRSWIPSEKLSLSGKIRKMFRYLGKILDDPDKIMARSSGCRKSVSQFTFGTPVLLNINEIFWYIKKVDFATRQGKITYLNTFSIPL